MASADSNVPHTGPQACPRCRRADLSGRHCKLCCPACGYTESCEDLFPGVFGVEQDADTATRGPRHG